MYFLIMLSTSRTLSLRQNRFKPFLLPFKAHSTMVSCCRNCYVTNIFYSIRKHSQKINSHAYIIKTHHDGKPLPTGNFVLERNFYHVHFSDKLKPLRIGPYKILDRLSDVTYELLSQDGSTVQVQRNHLIPYYPKEPLLNPHLRSFMRFSDSTQFNIPKPNNYANSDSSPFNSDESASDDDSPPKIITPSITSNYDCTAPSSNDKSPFKLYDHSLFKQIIKTPQTDISIDRSRHLYPDQSNLLPPPIDRTIKTHYTLGHQPQMEYRLFIRPSNLYK